MNILSRSRIYYKIIDLIWYSEILLHFSHLQLIEIFVIIAKFDYLPRRRKNWVDYSNFDWRKKRAYSELSAIKKRQNCNKTAVLA